MTLTLKNILSHLLHAQDDDWRLKLLQEWPQIAGHLSTRMRLEQVHDDAAIIGVYDVHWMHELFHMSRLITHKINQHLGEPRIKSLRFVLIGHKKSKRLKKRDECSGEHVQHKKLPSRLSQIAGTVRDEELRHTLIHFFQRTR